MKVERTALLAKLTKVRCASQSRETIEQSNCIIFTDDTLIAFNGEIYAQTAFKGIGENFAVLADDLVALLSKIPDDQVDISLKGEQLIVKGKRKRAGLTIQQEILLPYDEVPAPDKFSKAKGDLLTHIKMAAQVCDANANNFRTSHIYIAPDRVQATDRFRFLNIQTDTGLEETLLPADTVGLLGNIDITHTSVNDGWLFLKSGKEDLYALCCAQGSYFEQSDLEGILALEDGHEITLSPDIQTALTRASVMAEAGSNRDAKITLADNSIIIRTQKTSGWYEEKQKVKYAGDELKVTVSVALFSDILSKTNVATINDEKIKMVKDNIEFVVALDQ